jgi:alpha 1,6-mannosyltransferase
MLAAPQFKQGNDFFHAQVVPFFGRRGVRIAVAATLLVVLLSTVVLHTDTTKVVAKLTPGSGSGSSNGDFKYHVQPVQPPPKVVIPSVENGDLTFQTPVHNIPPKMWQIMLSKKDQPKDYKIDPKNLEDVAGWVAMNPDYKFTLVDTPGADKFLNQFYAHMPEVIAAFDGLTNVGMKSDLLRYLLLETLGGVYSDTDVIARRPIDEWVPEALRDKVNLIVGIEWDQQDRGAVDTIPHIVQFCQWTIAAAPGHPVFRRMTNRILASIELLKQKHSQPVLAKIEPDYFDVLNTTGPPSWTDAVFEELQLRDPSLTDTKDFSYLKEPRLVGDILVLAIDGFGMGQSHSGSTHDGSIPDQALISHRFRGSWKPEEKKD